MRFERSGASSFLELLSLRAVATSSPAPGRGKNDDAFLFAEPGLPFAERHRDGNLLGVADGARVAKVTVQREEVRAMLRRVFGGSGGMWPSRLARVAPDASHRTSRRARPSLDDEARG